MSSGTPPDSGRVDRFTIDDAVVELKSLVDLGKQNLRLTDQMLAALKVGHSPGGVPGAGAGLHGLGGLFKKLLGTSDKGPSIRHGVGAWLKHKIKGRGSRAERWKVNATMAARGAGKSLGMSSRAAAGLGRFAGAIAGAAGMATTVAGAFAAVAAAGVAAYKAVDYFTDAAMAEAKRLSQYSGGMAAVMAQREVGQILRDIKRGQATAGGAQDLMGAESRRKDQENRLEIVFDNAKNAVLTVLNDMVADVLKPAADAVTWMSKHGPFAMPDKPVEASGVAGMEPDVLDAVRRIDADARTMMDAARRRAAAVAGGGFDRPRPGSLP